MSTLEAPQMAVSRGGMDSATAPDVASREDEGILVHIHDMDGEEMFWDPNDDGNLKPVTILVAGSYSSRYRKAQESQTTRVVKKKNVHITGALLRVQKLELVASCVLAWSGFLTAGVPTDLTRDNVIEAFKKWPWVLEQVEAGMEDHAGFLKGS